MLGFNAFSEQAISDISLPVITGVLYATDSNDTASLTGEVLVTGQINTTDGTDFALLSGENRVDGVLDTTDSPDTDQFTGAVAVSGVISATDGTDTASLTGAVRVTGIINTTDGTDTALLLGTTGPSPEPPSGIDTHDGITPAEIRRARNLDRKIREKQLALYKAQQEAKKRRKQQLRDAIDPPKIVAKAKQNKLQSIQEVKADIPSVDTTELEQSIAYLENQRSKLQRAVELRKQQAYIQAQLAILEAQRQAELDDEESILMLL
jgi:hypothetical protein